MLLETEGKCQQNADLALSTIIYWPVTKHLGGNQLYSKNFRTLISAMTVVRTLPRKSLHVVVGLYYKITTPSEIIVTVIQTVSVTGTSLLEQSSLSFHCHKCCFVQE
jgi:hypothetical protein